MRIGILTRTLPPYPCGIGDHTVHLASGLRALGHEVVTIAGMGASENSSLIVGDDFNASALNRLRQMISKLNLDHLVLQYTPLMYTHDNGRAPRELPPMLEAIGEQLPTSLIVHETYFRTWRWPPSLLRGTSQKQTLQAMCRSSHNVFTASEPLLAEMGYWQLRRAPIRLHIGSNIPLAETNNSALRVRHGLNPNTVLLTLFGGGNNLKWMLGHVRALERRLRMEDVAHAWLLLGGVPRNWLPIDASVLNPGYLPLPALSAYLAATDIFLVPHWSGLSAKRGTLIAALQHSLPVVGINGYMTDPFWNTVGGVELFATHDSEGFLEAVVLLSRDGRRRRFMGDINKAYFEAHFTWPTLARRFLGSIQNFTMVQ